MCGIFGYVGHNPIDAAMMAHKALCDLEYRGYDSWGIASAGESGIFTKKAVGKISDADQSDLCGIRSTMSIGHSRWATHGNVSVVNSHPHWNHEKTIAVVHNGIVENHCELKAFLVRQLNVPEDELFVSSTDTEVIPHLIEYFIRQGKTFEDAFAEAGKMLDGRFAIVAMKKGEPYLLAIRDGSPLVIGRTGEGYYLASDVPAFLDYTRTVCYPGDRECMRVTHDSIVISHLGSGKKVDPKWTEVTWDKASATKEGHPHYMIKEIFEQPTAIDKAICQEDERLDAVATMIKRAEHPFFIGCGTAAQMAKLGELYAAKLGGTLARAFVGSEFTMYEQFLNERSLIFAVSQSGETADVLEALRAGQKNGAKICSLLNVVGSSMNRMSDKTLFINTGPEIAVASTKAATAQIAVLILLAHALGNKLHEGKQVMQQVVRELGEWVNCELSDQLEKIALHLQHKNDLYIIGRGLNTPIAHEAAIKIQEVSYIHAEGFPGGELKHGPIALIQKGTPVIALVPSDETKRDMESNTTELKCRGAYVIGIGPKNNQNNKLFDEWISTPDLGIASPIASIIPIQLLAYHLAVLRGNDPDKPRNLAKSVTVK
jgi:glucosamine--fructose-6-phosphate aminotransferase (isomerizing)